MASMGFSSLFSATAPLQNFCETKTNPSWIPPLAMAFLNFSMKNPFGIKSSFVNHGFSLQFLQFPGTILDSQRTRDIVYARAATEKSIHDFTVKTEVRTYERSDMRGSPPNESIGWRNPGFVHNGAMLCVQRPRCYFTAMDALFIGREERSY
ncbi:hypothetical protein NE237_016029 [Protea cynaroides]|uniref:Uncharacterized protein n=1 Tax=Protea cynaroides TaxID=273540 RepID=A0A9Q0QRM9_9MAGN|nr:hypothetical protein NE237_016029 [Protea cynaroides]